MKNILNLPYIVLGVCAAALLVACSSGASQSGLGASALVPSGAHAAIPLSVSYSVLYSFRGGSGRRRSPVCGPRQRQGHALRHDLLRGRKNRRRRNGLLDHAVRHGDCAP